VILRHNVQMIKKGWWLVAVVTLLFWVISLSISYTAKPMYRAFATFIVSPNPNLTSSRDVLSSLDTLGNDSVISTYADILNSNRIFNDTVAVLNLGEEDLDGYEPSVTINQDSNILELSVSGPDPEMVAVLTNNIGQNAIIYIKGTYQVFDMTFLDQAIVPQKHVSPQPLRDGGIAAGIGFLVGILLAVGSETIRVPLELLRERMTVDQVSNAFTQRHFRRCVESELASNLVDPMSLGIIDLAGLEDLIDVVPEGVLCRLMQEITAILRNLLRGNDCVGRWGHSGYAILLPATPGLAAQHTLERIRQMLSKPIAVADGWDAITMEPSIGLSTRQTGDETATMLIRNAELALEQARESDTQKTVIHPGNEGQEDI
jgi:diguanylate cyclase (GGDEF)-like protein